MTSEHSFRDEILQESALLAAHMQTFQREAFVTLILEKFVDNGDISTYEHCYYTYTSTKGSIEIDAYSIDDTDGSISLYLFDLNKQDVKTINTTNAMTVFRKLERFIEGALTKQLKIDISHPAYELTDIIYRRYHDKELTDIEMVTQKYKLFYLSTNPTSERFKYTIEKSNINDRIVEYNMWDINRLEANWNSNVSEEIEIDLIEYIHSGLPCLLANEVQSAYKSFLCIIPGHILADLYLEYGSRLLEGNVRSYLSSARKVNQGIKNTALNEADKFFVYNNGISATASKVTVKTNNKGLYITNIINLQIVNGAQTTATLAEVRRTAVDSKKQLSDVFVQMKLTEVDINQSETLIPNISRYSNSQNSISEADFFANYPYHLEIEKLSRRIQAPAKAGEQYETHWYYERLRAQYSNDLKRNQSTRDQDLFTRNNPKSQIITKTDLAKVIGCWRLEPHFVSRGAQTNFVRIAPAIKKLWESDPTHSHINDLYFQNLVSMILIYRELQSIVSVQPWYEGGYRANIVAFSFSKIVHYIKTKYHDQELNLQIIWRMQQVPNLLAQQLAITSKAAFDVIMTPPNRAYNISQWAKREQCWDKLAALDIEEVSSFWSLLISSNESKANKSAKRKDQTFVNSIDLLNELIELRNIHPGIFIHLIEFFKSERIKIGPKQYQELIAVSNSSNIPNERVAVSCMTLLKQAEEKGFRY